MPREEIVDKIIYARDFGGLISHLRNVERTMKLSDSNGMRFGITQKNTNRPSTGRARTHKIGKPLPAQALCGGIGPTIKDSCSFDSTLAKHVVRGGEGGGAGGFHSQVHRSTIRPAWVN